MHSSTFAGLAALAAPALGQQITQTMAVTLGNFTSGSTQTFTVDVDLTVTMPAGGDGSSDSAMGTDDVGGAESTTTRTVVCLPWVDPCCPPGDTYCIPVYEVVPTTMETAPSNWTQTGDSVIMCKPLCWETCDHGAFSPVCGPSPDAPDWCAPVCDGGVCAPPCGPGPDAPAECFPAPEPAPVCAGPDAPAWCAPVCEGDVCPPPPCVPEEVPVCLPPCPADQPDAPYCAPPCAPEEPECVPVCQEGTVVCVPATPTATDYATVPGTMTEEVPGTSTVYATLAPATPATPAVCQTTCTTTCWTKITRNPTATDAPDTTHVPGTAHTTATSTLEVVEYAGSPRTFGARESLMALAGVSAMMLLFA